MKKILVPIDGSASATSATSAIREAIAYVQAVKDAEILFLQVSNVNQLSINACFTDKVLDAIAEAGRAIVAQAMEMVPRRSEGQRFQYDRFSGGGDRGFCGGAEGRYDRHGQPGAGGDEGYASGQREPVCAGKCQVPYYGSEVAGKINLERRGGVHADVQAAGKGFACIDGVGIGRRLLFVAGGGKRAAGRTAAGCGGAGKTGGKYCLTRKKQGGSGAAYPGGKLVVFVSGAVKQPGVFELPPGSRVEDAVKAAGGFGALADSQKLNLARLAADGEGIEVPRRQMAVEAVGVPGAITAPGAGGETGGTVRLNSATQESWNHCRGSGRPWRGGSLNTGAVTGLFSG